MLSVFYFCLFSLSVFLQSCCNELNQATITEGGDMILLQETTLPISANNPAVRDTIRKEPFTMSTEMDVLITYSSPVQGLLSSAYAVSCDDEFLNSMVESSFTLSCDQDFMFDGQLIEAGSDELGKLDGAITLISRQSILVSIEQAFIDKVEFTNGPTTFTMKIQTSDEVDIVSEGTVIIDF